MSVPDPVQAQRKKAVLDPAITPLHVFVRRQQHRLQRLGQYQVLLVGVLTDGAV